MPDTDALHIEDAVSRAVAEALNARLSDETERRWKARLSQVPEAYDLYLQGRVEQKKRTTESNLRAMDFYRQAIEQDRSFPLPYVSLAETTLNGVTLARGDYTAVAAQVTALLDQADAVTPDLPETIAVRGWLATELYRMEDASVLLERAVALNPNNADAQRRLGNLYARMSQPRKAADQYAVAAQLDPMDFNIQVNRCLSLQDLAEYVAAEEACGRARQLNASHFWGPLATSYLEMGRGEFASALGWLDGAVERVPRGLLADGLPGLDAAGHVPRRRGVAHGGPVAGIGESTAGIPGGLDCSRAAGPGFHWPGARGVCPQERIVWND